MEVASQLPTVDMLRWLYSFHAWTAPRVLDAARTLTDERLRQAGVIAGGTGDGSLFQTLAHIVGAETLWLARWSGQTHVPLPAARDYTDLGTLAAAWSIADREIGEMLGSLSPDALGRSVSYMSVARRVMEAFPLWQTILHMSNHTTHHRAEACVALTALGSPPASVDLVDFMRST